MFNRIAQMKSFGPEFSLKESSKYKLNVFNRLGPFRFFISSLVNFDSCVFQGTSILSSHCIYGIGLFTIIPYFSFTTYRISSDANSLIPEIGNL